MMAENPMQLAPDASSATSGHALNYAAAVKEGPLDLRSVLPATTKLLFVTSEMGDFLKAGGLGEVSSALPRQLRALCDVRVLIPGFRQVRAAQQNMDVVAQMPRTANLPPWSLGRSRPPSWRLARPTLTGSPTSSTSMTGPRRWRRAICDGKA